MNTEIENNGADTQIDVPEPKSDQEVIAWLRKHETPLSMVEIREGRSGRVFYYVRHQYITETLNKICGFNWDFRILREWIHSFDEVTVLGELTLRVANCEIVKSQYGGNDVERYSAGKHEGEVVSMSDSLKAAGSDALKKCASLIGLGLDLSIPAKKNTLTHLHAAGSKVFGEMWGERGQKAVRILGAGRGVTSSKDLLDIEVRILIAIIEGDMESDLVQQAAKLLK